MKNFHAVYLIVASILIPSVAAAHAEEPSAKRVHTLPGESWTVQANFGVVTSATPDRFVCEEAFFGGDGWMLGVFGPTEWITFGERDVRRTEDGCSFDVITEVGARPSDATVDAASGAAAFVVNGEAGAGLFVSTDRGQNFERHAAVDPAGLHLTGVRFLDADTLIVSAYVADTARTARLFRVTLEGAAEELSVPPDLSFPYVLEASAGQIALLARRDGQVILWGAPDALADADELETTAWPTGARMSSDGQQLWIAGLLEGKGLTVGTRDAGSVTWTESFPDQAASCVGGDETALYLCGLARLDGADVFRVDGPDLVEAVDFRQLKGPRDCPATSDVGEICPAVWEEIAYYFGVDASAPHDDEDAGHRDDVGADHHHDASAEEGESHGDTIDSESAAGGGCATSPSRDGAGGALLLMMMFGMGVLRRSF